MNYLGLCTLLVPSYAQGIAFYRDTLGFELMHDTDLGGGKRWVVLCPPGAQTALLLAQPSTAQQRARIGDQTGGRVAFFLNTDDFAAEHARLRAAGMSFRESPRHEAYGTVAVFGDPFGNLWDLIELNAGSDVDSPLA